jgi:hypothetical protein
MLHDFSEACFDRVATYDVFAFSCFVNSNAAAWQHGKSDVELQVRQLDEAKRKPLANVSDRPVFDKKRLINSMLGYIELFLEACVCHKCVGKCGAVPRTDLRRKKKPIPMRNTAAFFRAMKKQPGRSRQGNHVAVSWGPYRVDYLFASRRFNVYKP